eukprot:CAMPEP_0198606100 /NCGR_PEP_ID=MMETSP1462-20131121/154725_1 /TAXON_ID=1333877 /ORGANISM="Brandtodinium nutriculum, Strain RCC3387" /LENGTH=290 /DNA_ID=CAMNT_0044337903 /DNA_START=230 /DNA_END=1101 /DNA_ORIENTATION=-
MPPPAPRSLRVAPALRTRGALADQETVVGAVALLVGVLAAVVAAQAHTAAGAAAPRSLRVAPALRTRGALADQETVVGAVALLVGVLAAVVAVQAHTVGPVPRARARLPECLHAVPLCDACSATAWPRNKGAAAGGGATSAQTAAQSPRVSKRTLLDFGMACCAPRCANGVAPALSPRGALADQEAVVGAVALLVGVLAAAVAAHAQTARAVVPVPKALAPLAECLHAALLAGLGSTSAQTAAQRPRASKRTLLDFGTACCLARCATAGVRSRCPGPDLDPKLLEPSWLE